MFGGRIPTRIGFALVEKNKLSLKFCIFLIYTLKGGDYVQ